jgi:hypothetical protein
MDMVFKAVKCVECQCIAQSPLILPCRKSVCLKHVNQQATEFYCASCSLVHAVPKGGFIPNDACEILINTHLAAYKRANESCVKFEAIVHDLEMIETDPHYHIDEAIGELRKEIQFRREQLKLEIDKRADQVIVALDEYQTECKRQCHHQQQQIDENGESLVAMQKKSQLSEWLGMINAELNETSPEKWTWVLEKSETEIRALSAKVDEIKKRLLLNTFEWFREKQIEFCQIRLTNPYDIFNSRFRGFRIFLYPKSKGKH